MNIISFVIVFLFGTIIGSFLNVVIYRFGTGRGYGGRSMCMTCSRTLSWRELIPVFSWLSQKGKCRQCHSKISMQYPVVEALSGLVFALLVSKSTISPADTWHFLVPLMYHMFMWSLLIVISVYDFRHKIIPNRLMYLFIVIAFFALFTSMHGMIMPTLTDVLAGVILPLPFAGLWYVSKGKWMGFGDVKLMAGIGWYLGLSIGATAIMLGFWIGALFAIGLLIIKRSKFTMASAIPFGPFLVLGTLLAYVFSINLFMLAGLFT